MANVILEETTVDGFAELADGIYWGQLDVNLVSLFRNAYGYPSYASQVDDTFEATNTVTVIWDGTPYVVTAKYKTDFESNTLSIGNAYLVDSLFGNQSEDTGEPFCINSQVGTIVLTKDTVTSHTFSIFKGDITDTATYRWKLENDTLVSIGKNDNPITTLEGGIVDGVFQNARYQLATPFNLLHGKDWAIEWRMSGDVDNTGAMAKIWDETGLQTNSKSESVIFRKTTKSISLSRYEGSHYHYGVDLSAHGLDYTAEHLYRLQNKVNADGTNMVWLYVDDIEIAPMRSVFGAGSDESDWVSGKDFSFGYMGTPRYIMSGFIMDDIAVWESGASEVFTEETETLSYGEYLANPKYRFSPFRGFFGYVMAKSREVE